MNTQNKFSEFTSAKLEKQMQFIYLNDDYKAIYSTYQKDRKKDLRKAEKYNLSEKWNDNSKNLIRLFKNNVGKRILNIKEEDYTILQEIVNICTEKKIGELLSIYDKKKQLVASGFFLKHKNSITILFSSTDFNNRKNGANTFLIDRAIYKYQNNFEIFNFGGSSINSIAKYFKSFGAESKNYYLIKRKVVNFW